VGATVIRRRTLRQYLDVANFPDGNPSADPDEHFPDEIWRIEQKSNENKTSATFVLASPLDFESQMLPDRQVVANHCAWLKRGGYRGPYCGYTGPAVATLDDTPTDDPAADRCGGRLRSCKLRFGESQPLRFGAFPSAGKVRQ
jgi:lambda family phage minor tail protein L